MAIIGCFYCQTELDIPSPDEGGPDFGTSIRCAECKQEFVIVAPALEGAPERIEQTVQPYAQEEEYGQEPQPQVYMSYAERMLAEQIEAAEVREYEEQFSEEQTRGQGFLARLTFGLQGPMRSLAGFTTAILVMSMFLAMCVISFIGGWLVGDELVFFLGKLFQIVTGG